MSDKKPIINPITLTIAPFGYFAFLLYLYYEESLKLEHFLYNFTMFLGWLVAIGIVFYQVQRNKETEEAIKKEEIRKLLEMEAFKEINKTITNLSSFLIKMGEEYRSFPTSTV